MCILKRIFLAPLNDGSRPDPLHDPTINRAVILTGYASLRSSVRYLGARAFVACIMHYKRAPF